MQAFWTWLNSWSVWFRRQLPLRIPHLFSVGTQDSNNCPIPASEYQLIRDSHATLASTGCTRDFCQAGRAIHTDEPRVGENRALRVVEQEAEEFVQELYREGFYASESAYVKRLGQVLEEIRAGSVQGIVREGRTHGKVGGNWMQTSQELEFGLRRAWRNSRKCIMRSHCEELKLCDLRGVGTSTEMVTKLLEAVSEAFNRGSIQPTVFVFSPRTANSRGPMIWNHQILQFAGYESEDGSITGDPASVELTKAIIELGWEHPKPISRWDLLPLVAMADGDRPALAELPLNLRKLVNIGHPRYSSEFEELDLKWVAFPALTRLGFDIGGVQYTAAPFIGWFMDAEIGVRNLADTFRFNALPDIVRVLGLTHGKLDDGIETFDDLPEYEQLSLLSRAQAELNYAVHWSFLQAKISMTDSLTASMKWCRYDDEFKKTHGYRLPADPYWLAPPQGSIIPLWHRGGAPNFQPKPMISKHVQDPIKAWRREKRNSYSTSKLLEVVIVVQEQKSLWAPGKTGISVIADVIATKPGVLERNIPVLTTTERKLYPQQYPNRSIAIYFCSAGTVAEKLANKLHEWAKPLVEKSSDLSLCPQVDRLNNMKASDLTANKIILLIVSSTGQGDIPANGSGFLGLCRNSSLGSRDSSGSFKYAVFGNGDSRYSTSYNGAAITINNHIAQLGGAPLASLFQSDSAVEPLPLRALKSWWKKLQPVIIDHNATHGSERPPAVSFTKYKANTSVKKTVTPMVKASQKHEDYQDVFLSTLNKATLVATSAEAGIRDEGSLVVSLQVGNKVFDEMSCVQLLPLNSSHKVGRALRALSVEGSTHMELNFRGENPTYSRFLKEFVDLELPFLELGWVGSINLEKSQKGLTRLALSKASVLEVLESLHENAILSNRHTDAYLQREICLDMPLLNTRTFSVASSFHYESRHNALGAGTGRKVDMMVKHCQGGRFSHTFLKDSPIPALLKYRFVDSFYGPKLRSNLLAPFVIITTGAGFGPVRCLLQWRIAKTREALLSGRAQPSRGTGISLFLGLKECDVYLTVDVLNEAMELNLIDMLDIVVSNPDKRRIYGNLPRAAKHLRNKLLKRQGMIFVCGNKGAADGAKYVFESMLGGTVGEMLKGRYVEEVY